MNSFRLLLKTFKSRAYAYATMEDHYFSAVLSPAFKSLSIADGFVRNVFVLMGGATIAMVIPVAVSPLLTRLYTPHDFGLFALFVSIVSVISTAITGNYDSAVMLPKKDEDAVNLIGICLVVSLLACSLLLLVCWLFGGKAGLLLGNQRISPWLLLVPVTVFIMGLQQTLAYWTNRKKQFKRLGTNRIVESVVTPGLSLALGLGSFGVGGLITGLVGGKVAATWMLGRGAWEEKKKGHFSIDRKAMLEQAKRYSDFPLYSAPTSFIDVLALQIPVFFLTKFFDPYVVGWFALTTRVIGAPLALIGSCVGQVYYQWITEAAHRDDDLRYYVIQIAKYLLLLVSIPVLAAVLFSPVLFRYVFGAQWGTAGEYARILIFPLAIKFIVSPLTTIMWASGNIRLGSVWKIVYFSARSSCYTWQPIFRQKRSFIFTGLRTWFFMGSISF